MTESIDWMDKFLTDNLRMWKDLGIPAPLNELQSIDAWQRYLMDNGAEATIDAMVKRKTLLIEAANALAEAGPEAEAAAGIYDNRPDLRPDPDLDDFMMRL